MKKYIAMLLILFGSMMVVSCQNGVSVERQKVSVGIMLSDVGLGDQSFSDAASNDLFRREMN